MIPITLEGTWEEIVGHADELAGKRVRVTVIEEVPAPSPTPKSIWDTVTELMAEVPDEELEALPRDGASEIDHYIYGTPKRNP